MICVGPLIQETPWGSTTPRRPSGPEQTLTGESCKLNFNHRKPKYVEKFKLEGRTQSINKIAEKIKKVGQKFYRADYNFVGCQEKLLGLQSEFIKTNDQFKSVKKERDIIARAYTRWLNLSFTKEYLLETQTVGSDTLNNNMAFDSFISKQNLSMDL